MSLSYQTHGDLWDRALIEFEAAKERKLIARQQIFLPLTLEIGTWREIKKSPLSIANDKEKIFNPPPQSRKSYLRQHRQLLWDLIHLHVRKSDRKRYPGLRDAS
jgi:hypothetical protein